MHITLRHDTCSNSIAVTSHYTLELEDSAAMDFHAIVLLPHGELVACFIGGKEK